jgi:hypothetical protein
LLLLPLLALSGLPALLQPAEAVEALGLLLVQLVQ